MLRAHKVRFGLRTILVIALGAAFLVASARQAHAATTVNIPAQQATIQAGIDAAVDGDTVVVAPGTYAEHLDFKGKAITVTSSGGPVVTTIDGSNTGTVVTFDTNETRSSVLRGFTITNGSTTNNGGGILISSASPTVVGNVVARNSANVGEGGGISAAAGAPLIAGNTINANQSCSGGGGLALRADTGAEIVGNAIDDNAQVCSGYTGGGGGLLVIAGSTARIERNKIMGNHDGISLNGAGSPAIVDNIIQSNGGDGINSINSSTPSIVQNLIVGNGGAPISLLAPGPVPPAYSIVNNTMTGNGATASIAGWMGAVEWWNNILTDGIACDGSDNTTPPALHDNNLGSANGVCSGAIGTAGNISAAPLFADTSAPNYRLQAASPSVGAGSGAAPSLPATDLDRAPRTQGAAVDQGAYEYSAPASGHAFLDGEPSEQVASGQQDAFTTLDAVVGPSVACGSSCKDVVSVRLQSAGKLFTVEFAAPLGQTLAAGSYTAAVPADVRSGSQPGFEVRNDQYWCGAQSGSFTIGQISFDGNGNLTSLDATFQQECGGDRPALFGSIGFGTSYDLRRTISPAIVGFGDQPAGFPSRPQHLTIRSAGATPLDIATFSISGTDASQFSITSNTCSGTTLAPSASCVVDLVFTPSGAVGPRSAELEFNDSLAPIGGLTRRVLLSGNDSGPYTPTGDYTPIAPTRILDTRTTLGGHLGKIGTHQPIDVQIEGNGGVPASGVEAVVMNVTVTNPDATSNLTIWPQGVAPEPVISNLNFAPNQTIANLVTVAIDNGGISVDNAGGNTDLIIDVVGYYSDATGPSGSRFHSLPPARLFDTRFGTGGVAKSPLTADQVLSFKVTGKGGVPLSGPTAVVMNVTATEQTSIGHVTVYPGDVATPNASNINLATGLNIPNLVVVKVPANGVIKFYAHLYPGQTVHLLADVVGYYDLDHSTEAGRLATGLPARLIDTRLQSPAPAPGCVPAQTALALQFQSTTADSFVFNVTVTGPDGPGFITVFPNPPPVPNASNVNFIGGQTVPNAVIVKDGTNGIVWFWNAGPGCPHLVIDIFGVFTNATAPAPAAAAAAASDALPTADEVRTSIGTPVH